MTRFKLVLQKMDWCKQEDEVGVVILLFQEGSKFIQVLRWLLQQEGEISMCNSHPLTSAY